VPYLVWHWLISFETVKNNFRSTLTTHIDYKINRDNAQIIIGPCLLISSSKPRLSHLLCLPTNIGNRLFRLPQITAPRIRNMELFILVTQGDCL